MIHPMFCEAPLSSFVHACHFWCRWLSFRLHWPISLCFFMFSLCRLTDFGADDSLFGFIDPIRSVFFCVSFVFPLQTDRFWRRWLSFWLHWPISLCIYCFTTVNPGYFYELLCSIHYLSFSNKKLDVSGYYPSASSSLLFIFKFGQNSYISRHRIRIRLCPSRSPAPDPDAPAGYFPCSGIPAPDSSG